MRRRRTFTYASLRAADSALWRMPGQTHNCHHVAMLMARTRRLILVVHIIAGVAVIGDTWGLALIHLQALDSNSLSIGRTSFSFTSLMVFAGGVPLSLISLASGVVLVVLGRWGVRQVWILSKLCLQLAVLATGALFIAPILGAASRATDLDGLHRRFLVLMAVQGSMLTVATVLAVFKPGRRRHRSSPRADANERGAVG